MIYHSSNFLFKGKRQYVHGTDLVNSLLSFYPKLVDLQIKFIKPTLYNGLYCVSASQTSAITEMPFPLSCTVKGSFSYDNNPLYFCFFQDPSLNITDSYFFNEKSLTNSFASPNKPLFDFTYQAKFSFIEELVVAMKFFCQHSSSSFDWRFASLSASTLDVLSMSSLSLILTRSVANKLRSASILIYPSNHGSPQPLGSIDFISN